MGAVPAPVESPVTSPAPGWARKLPVDEKVFLWMILVSTLVMTAFVFAWLFWSDHNVPTQTYRTSPAAFSQQVAKFSAKYTQADGKVHVPPGVDAYMMGARYAWFPQLVLKTGHEYRIWTSAVDTLHGWSLVGGGQNLNIEIAPNHAYGIVITPKKAGSYLIVCNEYCGLSHEQMQGRLIVED